MGAGVEKEQGSLSQAGLTPPPGEAEAGWRVVVVRDESLRDRVDRAVMVSQRSATVARVPGFLAAMGDLAQREADVVIGPLDAITGLLASTGQALRELCPGGRLLLVGDETERGRAVEALGAGFDAVLIEPYDSNELAKAMSPEADAVDGVGDTDAPPAETTMKPTPLPQAIQPGGEELGDADLIDALLGAGPFLERLESMIASQSGLSGVTLSPDRAAVPEGQASAAIGYAGRELGVLHAPPPVDRAGLEPWAAWAARWLAMRQRIEQLRDLSLRDELTGAWNRRYFNRFLQRILERARSERQQVTLLVFDIDDFKRYNDRFGHSAGDDILREAARLMQSVVREHDVVARIGGDEFAVIFWDAEEPRRQGSRHPDDVMRAARRFQQAICAHRFPKLAEDAHGTLTISGGLASYPWDGQTPDELLHKADTMAMQSKQQGKNAITLGPGALRRCDPSQEDEPADGI
ncbi:MAG: diguanylate cyclase [Planctomycetes bacterium]|jgi:diguanylate cyclase (GGDEF)-like protein|nr:diguanylate cyclase [Planctomycetota bacterium]